MNVHTARCIKENIGEHEVPKLMSIIGQALLQVVLADGQGVQKADHGDSGPDLAGQCGDTRTGGGEVLPKGKLDFLSHFLVGGPRRNDELPGDLCETVERFAAKAEGFGAAGALGGGVGLRQIGTGGSGNADAIVRDFNDIQSLVEEANCSYVWKESRLS